MPELGQLDLQFTLKTAGTLREDIEDQTGAIQDAALQLTLSRIAFLAGAEFCPGDDELSFLGTLLVPAARPLCRGR